MNRTSLLRYNFRVLMFNNWALLVIPLAASQLTVFWVAITQRYTVSLPASIVELVSPLLAAFLCAHLLTAEYRSSVGAILASKPVNIGRVVFMRFAIAIGLVWVLGALSLLAFYYAFEPYSLLLPLLSLMVSSLFLAMVALVFATLFRHPLTGFGVATLYWSLDLPPGPPLNPFLSLKSLSTSYLTPGLPALDRFQELWWVAKIVLVIVAILFYKFHGRLLFTLGSPMTNLKKRRALAWVGVVLVCYMVSGATIKVLYGYSQRGKLYPNDIAWFRRQMAPFGPLPVAMLFGSNFRNYLGTIPNSWRIQQEGEADLMGDTDLHKAGVRQILESSPNSMWAASAAELQAQFLARGKRPVEEKVGYYRYILEHYGESPYKTIAHQQIARLYAEATEKDPAFEDQARTANEAILKGNLPGAVVADAYRFLAESDMRRKDYVSSERNARKWMETTVLHEKFMAGLFLTGLFREAGKPQEAKQAARDTLKAIADFRQAIQDRTYLIPEPIRVRAERDASGAEGNLRSYLR